MKIILLFLSILVLVLILRLSVYYKNYHEFEPFETAEFTIDLLEVPQDVFGKQVFYYQSLRIEADFYPQLQYGDKLRVKGIVLERFWTPSNSDTALRQLYIKDPNVTILTQTNPFIKTASIIRFRVYDSFRKTLPYNEAVLLFGIVFGGSEGFSNQMKDAFRNTGVFHVVAASGMNVTMVGAFLLTFFSVFIKRQYALVLTIAGIFYYALISGFEPSILRASIMISITLLASVLGRQSSAFVSLFLTVTIMILISPLVLINVGFLLSFTSTLGILTIKPLFDQIKLFKSTKAISDDVSTSVSAQLGSAPVLVGTFSSYSLISLLVNALVLWTIPFIMILGGLAAFCSLVLPFVVFIPLYIALPFLWFFEKIVNLFGRVPLLQVGYLSPVFFAGYYLLLFGIVLYVRRHKRHED